MQRGGFFSKKLFIAAVICSVGLLSVFFIPSNTIDPFRQVLYFSLVPAQRLFSSTALRIREFGSLLSSVGSLKEENEQLLVENSRLMAENARFRDVLNENAVLRDQLGITERNEFRSVPASIIGYDPQNLGYWAMIDRGSRHGIRRGMPVVSGGTIVGKIKETYETSSRVEFLTSPESAVNGVVSATEARGIVRGEFGLGILFDLVLQSDVLQNGDEVVSSGLGGEVPRGLLIGTVRDVRLTDDHLYQRATIHSPVNVMHLRFVSVIIDVS